MKKGFFNFENEEGYDFLNTLNVNNKEIDALYYLYGFCHEFALALNEILGYEIVLWINYDEEINSNVLIHAFNTFEYEGKKYYADVRGITDSLDDITNGFDYYEELVEIFGHNNKEAKDILHKLRLNTGINDEIYEIINTYKTYYN